MLMLLVEAAHVHGFAARAAVRQCTSRGTARQAEPRRGSWCYRGRYVVHGVALGRAVARPALRVAMHTNSPLMVP